MEDDFKQTREELNERVVKPLEKAAGDWIDYKEKYLSFQLQLVTVASATFTIYLAIGQQNPPPLTKWGFVMLASSLVFGLLSVMLKLSHRYWELFFRLFEIEKKIFNSELYKTLKDEFTSAGYAKPHIYDETMDADVLSGNKKVGAVMTRSLFTKGFNTVAALFGFLQLISLLFATVLLLIGLI